MEIVQKNVKIMVTLIYGSKLNGRIFKIRLIASEGNLILQECVMSSNTLAAHATTFPITYTKLFVPVTILSNKDNSKLYFRVSNKQLTEIDINNKKEKWKLKIFI